MITATGWTQEYIDEYMTLPMLEGFQKHWATSPPVHVAVAAYLGWGKSKGSAEQDAGDFELLMASVPERKLNPNG